MNSKKCTTSERLQTIMDLRSRREELGLTLEQVGDACNVGKSTVRKWETGMIRNMRRDKVAMLAKVLRVNPMDIITVADDVPMERQAKTTSHQTLSPEENELLALYRDANDHGKEYILYIARLISTDTKDEK